MEEIKEWETKTMMRFQKKNGKKTKRPWLTIPEGAKWPRIKIQKVLSSERNNCRKCVANHGMGL